MKVEGESRFIGSFLVEAIHRAVGNGSLSSRAIRALQGSFVDFWRFVEEHELWGLLVVILHLYLATINPYFVHVQSSVVCRVFTSHTLVDLPRELGLAHLSGPEAMKAISPDILDKKILAQSRNARLQEDFIDRLGTLQLMRYGPGELQFCNVLFNHDPSTAFYHQHLFSSTHRRLLLLNMKFIITLRGTEAHQARVDPPGDVDSKLQFLANIREEVEGIMEVSGLATLLKEEIEDYRKFQVGLGALRAIRASNRPKKGERATRDMYRGGEDEEGEEMSRSSRKSGLPRYHGLLARGEPYSKERMAQLEDLVRDDEMEETMGLPPPMIWNRRRPRDEIFRQEFMGVKLNLSFLRSCNAAGRTEEGRTARQKAAQEAGVRFGNWQKEQHAARREAKAIEFGGDWGAAEQWEMTQSIIVEVQRDQTRNNFENLPRMGTCKVSCERLAFGNSKNASNRCRQDSALFDISSTKFDHYEWVMLLHDVIDHPGLLPSVRAKARALAFVVKEETVVCVESPALEVLEGAPFHVDLTRLEGVGIYHLPSESPTFKRLMAMDVALRAMCRFMTPLDFAESVSIPTSPRRSRTVTRRPRLLQVTYAAIVATKKW